MAHKKVTPTYKDALIPHDYPWVDSSMAFCTTRPAWCLYHDVRRKACLMGFIVLGVIGILRCCFTLKLPSLTLVTRTITSYLC